MNKNMVIIMLIVGALMFTDMFIPHSAHANSLQEYNITAEAIMDEAPATDVSNHTMANEEIVHSLSDIITKPNDPVEPIQITPEPTEPSVPEETKESVPDKSLDSNEPSVPEAPKADIQETAPPTPEAPEETKPVKEKAPAPTNPASVEPTPTEPEVTEPEATEPEVTEPEATEPETIEQMQETEPMEEDISVEEPTAPEEPDCMDSTDLSSPNHEDNDHGNCPKCGRHLWTNWDRAGCFTFLSDTTCDCGTFVKAGQCHHH